MYLFDAVRARRPGVSPAFKPALIVGGVGTAIVGVLSSTLANAWPQAFPFQVVAGARIHDFVVSGPQTYESSQDVFSSPLVAGMTFAQILFTLLLVGGLIVTSINAMRVGLLTRVIGWIGVFAGILFAFPVLSPIPIVPGVWLGALALIYAGRFPGGTPAGLGHRRRRAVDVAVRPARARAGRARGGVGDLRRSRARRRRRRRTSRGRTSPRAPARPAASARNAAEPAFGPSSE